MHLTDSSCTSICISAPALVVPACLHGSSTIYIPLASQLCLPRARSPAPPLHFHGKAPCTITPLHSPLTIEHPASLPHLPVPPAHPVCLSPAWPSCQHLPPLQARARPSITFDPCRNPSPSTGENTAAACVEVCVVVGKGHGMAWPNARTRCVVVGVCRDGKGHGMVKSEGEGEMVAVVRQ